MGAYWDLPPALGRYSFGAGMNASGYATMAVDRLGTGRSSRPLSATLSASAQAAAVHQVIQRLRSGSFGTSYDNVIVGGHSLGGAISVLEAATYPTSTASSSPASPTTSTPWTPASTVSSPCIRPGGCRRLGQPPDRPLTATGLLLVNG